MVRYIRIISLFISMAILVSSFVSCGVEDNAGIHSSVTDDRFGDDEMNGEEEERSPFEIGYPPISVSSLKFDLEESKLDEFKSKLAEVRSLFDADEEESEEKFKIALYELLTLQAEIETQRDIAHILYYLDMSSPGAWDDYIYAYGLYDETEDILWDFYNESKKTTNSLVTVLKGVFNKEFTSTVPSGDNSDYYQDRMETLEGEYNSLINSGANDAKVFEIYKQYLTAAEGLAIAANANNYYEYASKYTYLRKDTAEQREILREHVKKYFVPLLRDLKIRSNSYDKELSYFEYKRSDKYLFDKYDSFKENYLFEYFDSLYESSGKAMREAFEKDRVLIGDKRGSYKSAMVTEVGNTSICYFHEDNMTLDTVAHELGHYYAHVVSDDAYYYSYSLRETHSTANAMLFYSYLSDKLDDKAFKSAELYNIYNWMFQTIMAVIRDEFDEIIFSCDPSTLTVEELESIMSGLIDGYGVKDISDKVVDQLMTYWRRQGISYSMSNYSYAVANIVAFQIYVKSKEDYGAAVEIYRKTVEETENDGGYMATVIKAGLTTPYAEQTYIELQKLAELD